MKLGPKGCQQNRAELKIQLSDFTDLNKDETELIHVITRGTYSIHWLAKPFNMGGGQSTITKLTTTKH